MDLVLRPADLASAPVRDLLALHLSSVRALSPPGHSFALDLSGLTDPSVTVWSAWDGEALAGIGALKDLGGGAGEVKSMRTHPDHLRRGVGAALLEHIIGEARARGMTRLSLETGTGPAFAAALGLYLKRGFKEGAVFADYPVSEFNRCFHLEL
jgi:putative acetyltransferase